MVKKVIAYALCSGIALSPMCPIASGFEQDPAWEKFVAAKSSFHQELYRLLAKHRPDMDDLLRTHRDLQLALLKRRQYVFYYFIEKDPVRIVRNRGAGAFLDFKWSEEDEAVLSENVPGFKDLTASIQRLKELNNADPRWPEMQEEFKTLELNPEYLRLMNRMSRQISVAEGMLWKSVWHKQQAEAARKKAEAAGPDSETARPEKAHTPSDPPLLGL